MVKVMFFVVVLLSVVSSFEFISVSLGIDLQTPDLTENIQRASELVDVNEVDIADESDLFLFFGRFHPVLVHLPIGFLLFACLLELVGLLKRYEFLKEAVSFALLMGVISGLAAGVTGYFLSRGGGYGKEILAIHQWMGISIVILSLGAFLLRITLYERKLYRRVFHILLVVMAAVVMGTGHYGGSLTHGPEYLFRYMPELIRSWIGFESQIEEEEIPLIEDLDRAFVYEDIIAPILTTRCQSCHNLDRREGELLMTSFDQLMAGGESGPVIVEHQPEASELYNRLLLPERDEQRMPPRGRRQLTHDQIKLIGWWIEQGAPSSAMVSEVSAEEEIQEILQSLTVGGQDFFERIQVPMADQQLVEDLNDEGFRISPIAEGLSFLQVRLPKSKTRLLAEEFEQLLPLSEQITWLDLSRIEVNDSDLERLSDFKHLTQLSLQHTAITDSTLAAIGSLEHLEYINLYGTNITDQGLQHLQSLPSLKSLYLWQTKVSREAIEELKSKLTGVYVNTGINVDNETLNQE